MPHRFGKAELARANARLKMLNFYPPDPEAQAAIMELLAKMCPHLEALNWLVDAMVNHVGAWKGPKELRGVLCSKYQPADGIEIETFSFIPTDGERTSIERGFANAPPQLRSADPECCALVRSIADKRKLM